MPDSYNTSFMRLGEPGLGLEGYEARYLLACIARGVSAGEAREITNAQITALSETTTQL